MCRQLLDPAAVRLATCLLIATIAISVAGPAIAQLPPRHILSFAFFQNAKEFGAPTYSLELGGEIWFTGADVIEHKLIAPNGSEFSLDSTHKLHFDTFDALAPFFGNWAVVEKYGDTDITYQIALDSFSLNEVDAATPVITSPTSGASLPRHFTLDWTYSDGTIKNVRGMHRRNMMNISKVDVTSVSGRNAFDIDVHATMPGSSSLELAVNTSTTLDDPTLIGSVPIPGDRFDFRMRFVSFSTYASYIIVPEPATSWLALCALSLVNIRRR